MSLYLYGIAGTGQQEALGSGLAGEPLRRIEHGAVCAVAGEMDAPPRPVRPALTAHDAVVRRLADGLPALLPARFGQSLPDEQAVSEWLAAHGSELAEALTLVAGCVQMTLRVYGDPVASLPAEPPEPPNPETTGPGTRYLAQRRRDAERERSLPEIAPLREALRPLLKAERIERPAAPGRLHATAYDLIARAAAGDYTRLVAEATPALPPGWHVTASGPWPPYAFAPGPVR